MIVPFGPWQPDQPSLGNTALTAQNVLPALKSYRPVSGLAAFSSAALSARCQGAASFIDRSGNPFVFAGDVGNLYVLGAGATTFSDVSKAATTYTTGAEERWTFCQFGNYVIASNFSEVPQLWDLTSSTAFEDLITSGTTTLECRYLAANDKGFVFFGNTSDSGDGARPQRIWWCKQGDPRTVPTAGSAAAIAAQSDFQDITQNDAGWIMGLACGIAGADVVIVMERALIRGVYVGGDAIFTFDAVEGGRGTPAAGSLVQMGGAVFYLGEDGFYMFDGAQSQPIGAHKIDKWFFTDSSYGLDQNFVHRISGIADPINKVIMWAYPSVAGSVGLCDNIVAYNWSTGEWSHIPGVENVEILFGALAPGYSIDTLDSLSSSIDALPYSLDSRQLTGGARLIGAFDASHVLKTFTGDALEAVIDTGEIQPIPGQRAMVTGSRPLIEGTSVTPTVTPIYRDLQGEAPTTGSASSMQSTGWCPLRYSGRYHRHRVTIPAASSWTHASGIEVQDEWVRPMGGR